MALLLISHFQKVRSIERRNLAKSAGENSFALAMSNNVGNTWHVYFCEQKKNSRWSDCHPHLLTPARSKPETTGNKPSWFEKTVPNLQWFFVVVVCWILRYDGWKWKREANIKGRKALIWVWRHLQTRGLSWKISNTLACLRWFRVDFSNYNSIYIAGIRDGYPTPNITCETKKCCDGCKSYEFDGSFQSTVSEVRIKSNSLHSKRLYVLLIILSWRYVIQQHTFKWTTKEDVLTHTHDQIF